MLIDDIRVAELPDGTFADGYVGMAMFGAGAALFRDLVGEGSAVSLGPR
jgi:hypothetical protein